MIKNLINLKLFQNNEMTKFYWSIFIMSFGESLINIFVPIYLYNLGFKIPQILFFYFLVSLFFLCFAYIGAKTTANIGHKLSILISTPFLILYYLGLTQVNSQDILFYICPVFLALRMIFFNYGYHLNFLNHSLQNQRGQELAWFGILKLLAVIMAPFVGGLIATQDFHVLFQISSFLILFGTTPLLFSQDFYQKIEFSPKSLNQKITSKNNRPNVVSFSSYAIESIIGRTIWPIFLIIILGTIKKTGLVISLSMLISLLAFYYIGKITDRFSKIKLLQLGTFLYFFAWIGRIFADNAFRVLLVDSYKNLTEKILQIPWSAHNYDLAQRQNCFEFVVAREIIFNLSRVFILPLLILIFHFDFHPFAFSFLIAALCSLGYQLIEK